MAKTLLQEGGQTANSHIGVIESWDYILNENS